MSYSLIAAYPKLTATSIQKHQHQAAYGSWYILRFPSNVLPYKDKKQTVGVLFECHPFVIFPAFE
jgi:hypothetical protein